MQVSQAKNPWFIGLSIVIVAFSGGLLLAQQHGELRGWAGLPEACKDAMFPAFIAFVAWIFAKSPFAEVVASVVASSGSSKHEVEYMPSGAVKKTDTTVEQTTTVTAPAPKKDP